MYKRQGDILVGKVTPKGETASSPEEKLLRSIFGEKATDVRDSSLKMPPGSSGVVVDVRIFNRHGVEKDERAIAIERSEIESVQEDKQVEEEILDRNIKQRLIDTTSKEKLSKSFKKYKPGDVIDNSELSSLPTNDCLKLKFENENTNLSLIHI